MNLESLFQARSCTVAPRYAREESNLLSNLSPINHTDKGSVGISKGESNSYGEKLLPRKAASLS
jgi:hypothetical protein